MNAYSAYHKKRPMIYNIWWLVNICAFTYMIYFKKKSNREIRQEFNKMYLSCTYRKFLFRKSTSKNISKTTPWYA